MAEIFQPVRGTEEAIKTKYKDIHEGYLYFAYDTGNIYIDKDGARYLMGSSSAGIIYANGNDNNIIKADPDIDADYYYTMYTSALEDPNIVPLKDSLILNSDGRFFRVISVEDNIIHVILLAISGTSSGGGGGPVVFSDLSLSIDSTTIDRGMTFIAGQDYEIKVTGTSTKDNTVSLYFEFEGDNGLNITKTISGQSGVPQSLNINFLPVNDNIKMTVQVSSDNTTMTNLPTRIVSNLKIVEMGISKSPAFNTAGIFNGAVPVGYYLNGDPTVEETLHVYVDGFQIAEYPNIRVSSNEKIVTIPTQTAGSHIVGLSVSTIINGNIVFSDRINYELAWIDSVSTIPVIWTAEYDPVVVQYENFAIQYQVYDPSTALNNDYFSVYIYKEGILFSEISKKYTAGQWLTLDLTESYNVGQNKYTIVCGAASKDIIFEVTTKGSRDLGLVQTDALIFNLSATGRSNDEISMNRPIWTDNGYTAVFNKFNWYSNGWQNDNDGNGSYLSIANGANVTIPFINYNTNPATMFQFNDGLINYTIELRFRVKNVQEYSTLVTMIPYYYIYDNGIKSEHGVNINIIKERQANGEDVVIVTDDDGNWVMDEELSAKNKIVKDTEGVCFKILGDNPKYGLCIGTQEAYFRSPEGVSSVRYKEDEIINFSVVVSTTEKLASIYLNGILSGSLKLGLDSSFNIGNQILINSNYCDIDIYKIRFYKYGLTMPDVIHNYISDIHNLTLYDQNQLTKDGSPTLLSYSKLVKYNKQMLEEGKIEALTMPYAVLEIIDNNAGMKDPNKGSHTTSDDLLPWKKGNNRYCKITFVNPTLDALYNSGQISTTEYETHSPSYVCIGADINVQGTSSQGYPRRNYKTKHKTAVSQKDADKNTHEDWGWYYTNEKFLNDGGNKGKASFKKWKQDNPNYGTNKFTWKIDYMESSGSYNTGFANLVGNNIYNQHPLQYYNIDGIKLNGLRTSVYGFPVLVFHKHTKPSDLAKIGTPLEDEIYEYIGRYNINQDKGSDELYGFSLEVEQPYVNDPWEETIENDDGTIEVIHHDHPYISDVAECWEMTDNQGTWTSFTYPTSAQESHFSTYTIDSYDANGELVENPKLEVIRHYECRYHKDVDYIEAIASDEKPYDLTGVQEKINDPDVKEKEKEVWRSINTIPKMNRYIIDKWSNFERFVTWVDSTDMNKANPDNDITPVTFEVAKPPIDMTGATLEIIDEIKYVTFTKDTAAYRLQKFKSEFEEHLNLEYCLVYFVMTELLLCYDSRGKNMMLASYGPIREGGDYIWFPIFYDIDTQLGLNNIGATLWDYDCDATLEKAFSTPSSVLWVNFLAAFEDNIKNKYAQLRADSKLTYETIDGAYLCNPEVFDSYAMRGIRPIIAIGLDEYYKYVAPSKTGYYNTDGVLKYDNNSYAYAINGDRKLSRELLLRNRLNYMDSYWVAGSYTPASIAQGGIRMRSNANNQATSDKYLDSALLNTLPATAWAGEELATYPVAHFDATPNFEITPFLKQYVFAYYDKSPGQPIKYQGTAVSTLCSDSVSDGYRKTPGYPEQIVILPAEDYLSDLGDLSTKYLSQFTMMNGIRILELNIGSDVPGYYNGLLGAGTGQFNINDSKYVVRENGELMLNQSRKSLLRRINLTNVTSLKEILDVSGSDKLQECRALGTEIQYVTFAEGAPLDTIHLPKSVSRIDLTEARELTHILTERPVVFEQPRETYTGLYLEGVTDFNEDTTDPSTVLLNRINIIGGSLGYDSYTLLENALKLKDKENLPSLRLRINLENVAWSPYQMVEYGTPQMTDVIYYQVTDHSNFIEYTDNNPDAWDVATLNGEIFTYTPNPKSSNITSLALLDKFINDYNRAKNSDGISYYTNLSSSLGCPNITGSIFVANHDTDPILEADLTTKYAQYFPNLKIYAENITEAKVTKYVRILDTGIVETIETLRSDNIHPLPPTKTIPAKAGYDFIGWSKDIQGTQMFLEYQTDVNTGNGSYVDIENSMNSFSFDDNNSVLVLYAQYQIHQNLITIKQGEETIGGYLVDTGSVFKAPTQIYKYIDDRIDSSALYDYIPYKDDSSLEFDKTYHFVGYSLSEADTTVITSPVPDYINKDITIYTVFSIADVYDNVLMDDSYYGVETRTIDGISYNILYLTDKANSLQGKITLPNNVNGKTITGFNNRTSSTYPRDKQFSVNRPDNITHIFWERGSELTLVGEYACYYWQGIRYFELPNFNTRISKAAFAYTTNLFKNINQEVIDNFFEKIIVLKLSCFLSMSTNNYNIVGNTNLGNKTINLPNILQIEDTVFSTSIISNIVFGSPENTDLDQATWTSAHDNSWNGILYGTSASGGFVDITPTKVIYFSNADSSLDDQIKQELETKLGSNTEIHIAH